MFKFNFDVASGEATVDEEAGAQEPDQKSLDKLEVEPFREVLPSEVADSSETSNDPNGCVIETLGVRHLAGPITAAGKDAVFEHADKCNSDLIPRVYEGGYKVWECTLDVLRLLNTRTELVRGANLLDLGCGAGLIGLSAMLNGAKEVHFHDYNASVLLNLTIPNSRLLPSTCAAARFFSGDWKLFQSPLKYDVIVTCETIYRRESYETLCDLFDRCLSPQNGKVLVAAKSVYFGVGGTVAEFENVCVRRGWQVEKLFHEDSGVSRDIILLRK